MKTLITFAALTLGNIAFAENPFCVQTGYGLNCWYYSLDSCRSAAESSDGVCIPNPNYSDSSSSFSSRPSSSSSSSSFCVRTGYGDNCGYFNYSSCVRAAKSVNGMCITK